MKKYTIISFIFIVLAGLLTYVNTDSSTTFSILGVNITLYNALWTMVFMLILYLISIIYFATK
jgi:ABC-type polysaccharide/polyol phosphate export permease